MKRWKWLLIAVCVVGIALLSLRVSLSHETSFAPRGSVALNESSEDLPTTGDVGGNGEILDNMSAETTNIEDPDAVGMLPRIRERSDSVNPTDPSWDGPGGIAPGRLSNPTAPSPTPIPTPTPVAQWCPALSDSVSPQACADETERFKNLPIGVAGFKSPDDMYVGDTRIVSVAVSRDRTLKTMPDVLGSKPTDQKPTKIARLMSAKLEGDNFEITPEGLTEQDLGAAGNARWTWRAKALPGDRHSLEVSIFVDLRDESGRPMPNLIRVLRSDIPVRVGWFESTDAALGRLTGTSKGFTTLLSALAALVIAGGSLMLAIRNFGKRRKSSSTKAQSGEDQETP